MTTCKHDLRHYPPFTSGGLIEHGLASHDVRPAQGTATLRCEHGRRWHWDGNDWRRARPWQLRDLRWLFDEVRYELRDLPADVMRDLATGLAAVAGAGVAVGLAAGVALARRKETPDA